MNYDTTTDVPNPWRSPPKISDCEIDNCIHEWIPIPEIFRLDVIVTRDLGLELGIGLTYLLEFVVNVVCILKCVLHLEMS